MGLTATSDTLSHTVPIADLIADLHGHTTDTPGVCLLALAGPDSRFRDVGLQDVHQSSSFRFVFVFSPVFAYSAQSACPAVRSMIAGLVAVVFLVGSRVFACVRVRGPVGLPSSQINDCWSGCCGLSGGLVGGMVGL